MKRNRLALRGLFVITVLIVARSGQAQEAADRSWRGIRQYPPLVFTSKATLDCSISATENGRQVVSTVGGQGFTFSAEMRPIRDGKLHFAKGTMEYQFNAFPTSRVPASFSGLGKGTITELKVEVDIRVRHFLQPGGVGTKVTFAGSDIDTDGAYVELTGVFVREKDQKTFPFRVLFGSSSTGSGEVTPADSGSDTTLASKRVVLGTASKPATVTTALFEEEDDVPTLK